jgi:hypothetical protein
MATDEPLREQDLPPHLREQVSETPQPERDDQSQPMIGDLVYRPGESSEDAAQDAMMRPGDSQGQVELVGLGTPQSSEADMRDETTEPERVGATGIKPPDEADKPRVDDAVSAAKKPVETTPDSPPTASHFASPVSGESSDDRKSSVEAAGDVFPAEEPPAEPMADSDDAVAPDSSEASAPAESAAASADTPSTTTGNSSATAAADAPGPAAASSPPSASPGLALEQVTSAAGNQPQDLPPHTTELLTPGADGQPPMARPIVLVRLADDVTHRMINDALAKLAADSSELMENIAADHVDYIFWQIRAQERAILRFD